MSTEFKKGDRVLVKPGATSTFGWAPRPEDAATPLIVQRVEHDHRVYVLSGGPDYGFRPEDLTHADAVHAVLDPSKVKAGDTVTLRVTPVEKGKKPFTVEGEVYGTPGALMVGGLWVMNDKIATLTAHQPAPEPEPEWKPGTVAVATVKGVKGVRVMRLHPDPEPTPDDPSWVSSDLVDRKGFVNGWDGTIVHNAVDVTDVRPLVVIDPAEVDVEALTQVARKVGDKSIMAFADSTAENIVRAVLAASGIEVPR